MKIFVTGAEGQLGSEVLLELAKRNIEAIGSTAISMNITNERKVQEVLLSESPDAVIHCAAWTNVDAAQQVENRQKVFDINATGTKNIASVCRQLGCKMLYVSTDYVFNGQGEKPWEPDSKDYSPLNIYGSSKLQGELAVVGLLQKYFIVRTSWVFGKNGTNFVRTMLNLSKTRNTIRVVNDQVGRPTYAKDLARLLVDMILTDKYGYYHATNEGDYISWYDFAEEIFKQVNSSIKVAPVTTEAYGLSEAIRPQNSRLSTAKLQNRGFELLPTWKDALERYLKEINYGTD